MNIIIVDDSKKFLESMDIYISMKLKYVVLAKFDNATSLLNFPIINRADIILMDIEMPKINGIEATKRVLWENNKLKVIAITNHQEKVYLTSLISAGFKGCVYKNNIFDELDKAINLVHSEKLYFPEEILFQNKK